MHRSETVTAACPDGVSWCSEKEGGTEVILRVAYSLPDNLSSYVGPVGVWGDVNDILQENLICMKVRTHCTCSPSALRDAPAPSKSTPDAARTLMRIHLEVGCPHMPLLAHALTRLACVLPGSQVLAAVIQA